MNGADPTGMDCDSTTWIANGDGTYTLKGDLIVCGSPPAHPDVPILQPLQGIISGGGGGGGDGGRSPGPQNNAPASAQNAFRCKAATNPLAQIAHAADNVSTAADLTGVTAAGAGLGSTPTIIGPITAAGVVAGADLTSEGAGIVSVLANIGAGRFGNAALGAFGVAIGVGSAPIKVAPEITQFLSRVGLTGLSHAFASICP